MKFGVAVKGIVRKDGKILIVKRAESDNHRPNNWETVGGGIDENETPHEALMREVMEEAGLDVKIVEPFNVFSFKKDDGEIKIGITFLCDWINGEVVLSEEHSEHKWIEPDEFANFESVPSLHEEIKKYSEKYYE
ncbi:MAG: Hydrolase, NUDIX family [Candidatus Moranbacteria bacterium GW2011_GWD2_36_12]|nr:MAG: Hydrolase, NUDIX family [Candidatus Moranbacteria bacterium GW2011_GWD2_36_12]KKQ05417.1 MAG: Hydrolase, NUDIX family [Candidatus Moranbacteria bacterium GW2011_GWE2_36_40]